MLVLLGTGSSLLYASSSPFQLLLVPAPMLPPYCPLPKKLSRRPAMTLCGCLTPYLTQLSMTFYGRLNTDSNMLYYRNLFGIEHMRKYPYATKQEVTTAFNSLTKDQRKVSDINLCRQLLLNDTSITSISDYTTRRMALHLCRTLAPAMSGLSEVSYLLFLFFIFLTCFIVFIVCTLDLVLSVLLWRQQVGCYLVSSVPVGSHMAAAAATDRTCKDRLQPGEFGWDQFIYGDICRFLSTSMLATEIELFFTYLTDLRWPGILRCTELSRPDVSCIYTDIYRQLPT